MQLPRPFEVLQAQKERKRQKLFDIHNFDIFIYFDNLELHLTVACVFMECCQKSRI